LATNKLASELQLIERALRADQFRLVVVQYNQHELIGRLKDRLATAYPKREMLQLDGKEDGPTAILERFQHPPKGIMLLSRFEVLLDDEAFLRSLNQRRDWLTQHALGLIILLPSGGDFLLRLSRAMPDLWSLRNLVAELHLPLEQQAGGQFLTDVGQSYHSFVSQAEAETEVQRLEKRIAEVETLPGSRPLLASLRNRLGNMYMRLSRYSEALTTLEAAEQVAREQQDFHALATALNEMGEVLQYFGRLEKAKSVLQEALQLRREIRDQQGEGETLNNISGIYRARGDYATALDYLEQSLAIRREIGDKSGEATTLKKIATSYNARGNNETAFDYQEQS